MSRSHPEQLRVLLGRRGLIVMDDATMSIDLSEATPDDQLSQIFEQFLKQTGVKSIEVLLSSALVDTVVIPGLVHWLADTDLQALGRTRLAAFYGTDQEQREVLVSRENYGIPCLGFSAPQRLLDALRAVAAAQRVTLVGIRPLAATTIATLSKEIRASPVTAIWIEENEFLWIGLCADGQWRSARSLPSFALQHTTRHDLLQRECLAAGLVSVDRIFCAAIGVVPPNEWGEMATDISQRLQTAGRHHSVAAIDFDVKRRHRMGWILLLTALGGLATTASAWIEGQASYIAATEALMQQRQTETQASEQRRATTEAFQAAYARTMTAYRFQSLPWSELFTALNECGGETIGLTDFKADALNGSLAIEGETTRFEDLQAFADALGQRPRISGVRITAMAQSIESGTSRIKFSLIATWSSDAPSEMPPKS